MKIYQIVFINFINFLFLFNCSSIQAKHLYIEEEYQQKWCSNNNGKMEVVYPNGGRCDCVTDKYAIEFDFAKKFHESIGQALEYSIHSGKQPGIVLILENAGDEHFLDRLMPIANKYNIKVWTMNPEGIGIEQK